MTQMRTGRPSHTTVVAYLALFVALSGTAIAASGKIGTSKLKKSAVTTNKIAGQAVTTNKLAKQAVTTERLADAAVTEPTLADDAVSKQKLQPQSVGSAKIEDLAVRTGKLEDNAVTSAKVGDGALSPTKIAQIVADVTYSPGTVMNNTCAVSGSIAVPALQSGDDVLVYPRDAGGGAGQWPSGFVLDAFGITGSSAVTVKICNLSGTDVNPGAVPFRVLGFR